MTARGDAFDLAAYPWPPGSAFDSPMTPSLFEIGRACPMQAACRTAQIYPRRSDAFATLGTAFHQTLEHLDEVAEPGLSPAEVGRRAIGAFAGRLEHLLIKARAQPRWHEQTMPAQRHGLLRQAVGLAAKRLHMREPGRPSTTRVLVEKSLTSPDGLLHGRPDCIEVSEGRAVVIDFKTGDLRRPESVERYERQLLFYALLCQEVLGIWPERGLLINHAQGVTRAFDMDRAKGEDLAVEARSLLQRVRCAGRDASLAMPGPHCESCDFRPWCDAYWRMLELGAPGDRDLEFRVIQVRTHADSIYIRGRTRTDQVEVEGRATTCPGLALAERGAIVRVLDSVLVRVGSLLSAELGPNAEVFVRRRSVT